MSEKERDPKHKKHPDPKEPDPKPADPSPEEAPADGDLPPDPPTGGH